MNITFYGVIIADTSTLKDGLLAFFFNGNRETPLRNNIHCLGIVCYNVVYQFEIFFLSK